MPLELFSLQFKEISLFVNKKICICNLSVGIEKKTVSMCPTYASNLIRFPQKREHAMKHLILTLNLLTVLKAYTNASSIPQQ